MLTRPTREAGGMGLRLGLSEGYGTDTGHLERKRLPEAAAVAREVEAVLRGVADEVGGFRDCERWAARAAPSAEALRAAPGGDPPPARAPRYAAAKAAPEPVSSGLPGTGRAGTSSASPSARTTAPREPSVTITSGTPRRRSARSSRP